MAGSALSRRSLLAGAGAGTAGLVAAGTVAVVGSGGAADAASETTAACGTASTEQEVGPFYVSDGLVRSDITAGEDGVPLTLTVTYLDSTTCEPAVGLAVDIWEANAAGVYSDEQSEDTVGETYLRGIQLTGEDGTVTFTTILPGWYAGRSMHIHNRVYSGGTVSGTSYSYSGATLLYTGQWFFPADVDDAIAETSPYSSNQTTRTTNAEDRVYTEQSGSDHVVSMSGSTTDGYVGTLTMYVDAGGTTSDEDGSSVTVTASSTSLVAGHTLTLSGVVTDTTTSTPVAGATVLVTRTVGSTTGTATVTADDDGAWELQTEVYRSATYQATYAGDDAHAAASSDTVDVAVAYRVILSDVSATAAHTDPIAAHGRLLPAQKGKLIRIEALDGKERVVAHARTDADGHWKARWKMPRGKHRVRAVVAAGADNGAGVSRTVTVRRT